MKRTLFLGTVIAAIALVAPAVTAPADATPRFAPTNTLHFELPAVGGIEAGPAGVPGGSFQRTTVVARPGLRTLQFPAPPASVSFSVVHLAPYHYQYNYRYVSVQWRNLRTGRTGHVNLRHWRPLARPTIPGPRTYPATLPTSATAVTGAGPVVATVSVIRAQYLGPSRVISVIPGVSALAVD